MKEERRTENRRNERKGGRGERNKKLEAETKEDDRSKETLGTL
jgi:hypothetical protein